MTPTLVFLYGYPAAGKTTYAIKMVSQNPRFVRISADEIRRELYGSQDVYGDPSIIFPVLLNRIRTNLMMGNSVVYDATNLRKSFRLDYLNRLTDIECFKVIIKITAPKDICIERHLNRGRNIPLECLLPLYEINEPPRMSEGWDKIMTVRTVG